ncbi:MAG: nucleotidyltransferase [Firmicutes bacterium]|nr:nucleotidyltransferase [Bacillota bacterium]MBR3787559.1 nucleotidyltransferase [Bacillota bacterium]MBR6799371.1 nucleotidyltransferase [Bacillota bacterium]
MFKNQPTLVIMAAGMGSRYGGSKQVDKMTDAGEIILDFSLYDAMLAGFNKVVFIIREEHRDVFRELVDERAGRFLDVEYAYQKLEDIPEGYEIPEGREKPWGTSHAVMAARHLIDGPFVVINADDYYGPGAFSSLYEYLLKNEDGDKYEFCMAGYKLENTVTENGHVARGVCELDENGYLVGVTERTKIEMKEEGIAFTEDDGESWTVLPEGTVVSMNFWGFSAAMMKELEAGLPAFLDKALTENPLKGEYLLPFTVDSLIKNGKARVKVLTSPDKWCGVTYKEDKEDVKNTLEAMKDKGLYPEKLWK